MICAGGTEDSCSGFAAVFTQHCAVESKAEFFVSSQNLSLLHSILLCVFGGWLIYFILLDLLMFAVA
jgi:hypothetical protein